MGILILVIACIVSAILYRAGGMGKEATAKPTWIPTWMRESWVRDWLCPAVLLGVVMLFFGVSGDFWWCYLIFYGLSGAAFSTYWDWLFGYDNFFMHGLGCSLATIPLYWCGIPWIILLIHGIICTLGMGFISKISDKDYVEEFGRGIFYIL